MKRGLFVAFEGVDGSGKTTLCKAVAACLPESVMTREPGGTPFADRIRAMLLETFAQPEGASLPPDHVPTISEPWLFGAARVHHVSTVISPALAIGKLVLCDRYVHSTIVYQGEGARDLAMKSTLGVLPDLVVHVTAPEEVLVERLKARKEQTSLALLRSRASAFDRLLDVPIGRAHTRDGTRVVRVHSHGFSDTPLVSLEEQVLFILQSIREALKATDSLRCGR